MTCALTISVLAMFTSPLRTRRSRSPSKPPLLSAVFSVEKLASVPVSMTARAPSPRWPSASAVAVTAYLDGTAGTGGDAAGDVISGAEILIGSANNDTLFGDGAANVIDGGNGNDTLVGGAGADTLTGGAGNDTVSYSNAASGLTVSLGNTALNTGDAAGDVYTAMENLTGSGLNDTLYGDGNANAIDGGAGNDMLIGGAGADTLTGGSGTDTADYSGSTGPITAYLTGTAGT
ncbi:MAG: hypothetical protein B7Y33_04765, partial [Hydrogenophilales bacterium 16-62-9]